jgi:hypothetical protein
MSVWMPFWGPNAPILDRPYLSIDVGNFWYGWTREPRLLEEPYRDPTRLRFPLRLQNKPRPGSVVLTAPGERPIRLRMGKSTLWYWDVWHGPILEVKDKRATAHLLRAARWTATIYDGGGRVREAVALNMPSRDEVRPLYEEARRSMSDAARDPAHSPLCKRDDQQDLQSIVQLSESGSSGPA